jgi:class 3 adenylate cyclase
MFTDIEDFTMRFSQQTREQQLKILELQDVIMRPIFKKFNGNIVKTIGDSFLVTFESPTNAILCGMEVQKAIRQSNDTENDNEKMKIRIAINAGEVTLRDGDVFGEAVNIASRIEGIAETNEVYFTEAVYLSMNKKEIPSAEIGFRHLKGIPNEIKVYKVLQEDNLPKQTVTPRIVIAENNTQEKPLNPTPKYLLAIVIGTVLVLLLIIANRYFFSKDTQSPAVIETDLPAILPHSESGSEPEPETEAEAEAEAEIEPQAEPQATHPLPDAHTDTITPEEEYEQPDTEQPQHEQQEGRRDQMESRKKSFNTGFD